MASGESHGPWVVCACARTFSTAFGLDGRPPTEPLPAGAGRIGDMLFEVLKYDVFGDGTVGR